MDISTSSSPSNREDILQVFRRHIARIHNHVRTHFESHKLSVVEAGKLHASLVDGFLLTLFDYTIKNTPGVLENGALKTLSINAIGGYGRGMLAPFSDIDLLFLTEENPSPQVTGIIENILYILWDLGIKIGYSTRSIQECLQEAAQDTTVRTSLLDLRLLYGDHNLYEQFRKEYYNYSNPAEIDFVRAKQLERRNRHIRYGDNPYVVEPNVKEGRGGLRDMQTLYWLCRNLYEADPPEDSLGSRVVTKGLLTEQEAKRARRSWEFLWTVRFHLHYVAGSAEERLTFDMQPVVGSRMGYTRHGQQVGVERFMRHYFLTAREVMRLTHVLEPAIIRKVYTPSALPGYSDPSLEEAGFMLVDDMVMQKSGISFDTNPIMMLRLLSCAQKRQKEIHPMALQEIIRWERRAISLRGNKEAGEIFLSLLTNRTPESTNTRRPFVKPHYPLSASPGSALPSSPETKNEAPSWHITAFNDGPLKEKVTENAYWLHVLNETGLMGRLIPGWSHIVGQMQFDTYHVFTVDEHIIKALHILNQLESGKLAEETPVAYELIKNFQSRRALYVAVLLHDIAKGHKQDHSVLGSEMALEICPLLGMSAEETETVSWLVLHHLLLSHTAFQRDIDDPKTLLDLVDTIQSPERLRLLFILTVVDIKAVNPRVWNAWKATLLKELYTRMAEILAGGMATTERDARVEQAKHFTAELLEENGFSAQDIATFLNLGYPGYWLSFDQETHLRHASLIIESEHNKNTLTLKAQHLPARGVTEITIYTVDHPGLFSHISGALALVGASIVDARIHTMTNGMALDTFWVQDIDHSPFDDTYKLERLRTIIEQILSHGVDIRAEIIKSGIGHVGKRMRAILVPPRVVFDNSASNTYTIIEVNGRDRPGLLFDVTEAMSQQGLQIASAHITTYGMRAVDVFYVKDLFGLKITDSQKLDAIRCRILEILDRAEKKTTASNSKEWFTATLASVSTYNEEENPDT